MSITKHLRPRQLVHGVSIAALLMTLPGVALAQSTMTMRATANMQAATLHHKADLLLQASDQRNWPAAAELLEQAASLRADDDPEAIREQEMAAEMRHHAGRLSRAQDNLEQAADRALINGRVLQSAQLFLKAAFVANERGHRAEASTLARNAERLAHSPHLTQEECDCILSRIAWLSGTQQQVARR